MSSDRNMTPLPLSEYSVGRRITALGRMARSYLDSRLAPLGIGFSQAQILVALWEGDGISQHEICRRLLIDKSVLARTIRPLVEMGYVERLPDPRDERAYRVVLTEAARAAEAPMKEILRSWTTEATKGFSAEEYATMRDLLARMIGNAEKLLAGE